MDDGSRLSMTPWLIAVVLLLLAAYFAVTETAIASVSRSRIKAKADRGDPRAEKAQFVLDHFDQAVTTLLICTNIVHIAAAAIVTVAVTARWGLSAVSLSTLITTIVVFFAGEMLPKSIAKSYSERFTLSNSGTLKVLMALFSPLSSALTAIGHAAAGLTKGDPEISVTEDELYDLIEDMTEEGTLDEEQGDLISSALQFGDVTVSALTTGARRREERRSSRRSRPRTTAACRSTRAASTISSASCRSGSISSPTCISAAIWTCVRCWTRRSSSTRAPTLTSCCPSCPAASRTWP